MEIFCMRIVHVWNIILVMCSISLFNTTYTYTYTLTWCKTRVVMSQLRLHAGFSPYRPQLDLRVVHMVFVVDEATLGYVFLHQFWFLLPVIISSAPHIQPQCATMWHCGISYMLAYCYNLGMQLGVSHCSSTWLDSQQELLKIQHLQVWLRSTNTQHLTSIVNPFVRKLQWIQVQLEFRTTYKVKNSHGCCSRAVRGVSNGAPDGRTMLPTRDLKRSNAA